MCSEAGGSRPKGRQALGAKSDLESGAEAAAGRSGLAGVKQNPGLAQSSVQAAAPQDMGQPGAGHTAAQPPPECPGCPGPGPGMLSPDQLSGKDGASAQSG